MDARVDLTAGFHRLDLRYFQEQGLAGLSLAWLTPGAISWKVIPREAFRLPGPRIHVTCGFTRRFRRLYQSYLEMPDTIP